MADRGHRPLYRIKEFFEREFTSQVSLRFDVAPQYVVGRESTYAYASDVDAEIQDALFSPGGRNYDPAFAAEDAREYTVRMIYYLNLANGDPVSLPGGGAWPTLRFAINPAFWLDSSEEGGEEYGTVGSAHEFGHLLGMPPSVGR